MSTPADQSERDRFIHEISHNFSVVASAGSGKTRAITDRIVALARSEHAIEWLPKLVVVTYTNRAADEMQQRARQALLGTEVSLDVMSAFGNAFFGTIHSFCVKLLRRHGHHLALPAQLDLTTDDDALWREFVQQHTALGAPRDLLRLAPARRLLELGRVCDSAHDAPPPGAFPAFDFSAVYACVGKGAAARTIAASQDRLREWERAWREGEGFLTLPSSSSKAAEFSAAWSDALTPIRNWMRAAAFSIGVDVARAWRRFRLTRGALGYDDQLSLALALLRHPEAGHRIRGEDFRVILDEAQDTDPTQFAVLCDIARPPEASGEWPATATHPPRPGHFSMVGDFQQSIYSQRADLHHYRRVHQALIGTPGGDEVKFSVTFRLDSQLVDFVNATFPSVLTNTNGQVAFVELHSRPDVLPGQLVRLDLGELPDISEWRSAEKMRHEADVLARWLHDTGLDRLRAGRWSDVAMICPRTRWFAPLRRALREVGLDAQVQSEREVRGDSAAFAWFTALAVVMSDPDDDFELAGVLREIFGVSDHDIATRAAAFDAAKRLLDESRERIATLPLFSAVQELLRATALLDRLSTLPAFETRDAAVELDDLLTRAATMEADAATLADFAEAIRQDFLQPRPVRAVDPGAIQLITGHKAKGSEWPVVIVPFFGRSISGAPANYPRIVLDPRTGGQCVVLDGEDLRGELKEASDLRAKQVMERLLYVALTRAKHALVLVDDLALFAGKKGTPESAQASLLRCVPGQPNVGATQSLSPSTDGCSKTKAVQAARATAEPEPAALPACVADALPAAIKRAARFIKRNPSALAEAAYDAPAPGPAVPRPAGAIHGTWWHESVELLDWTAAPETWNLAFDDAPDPERARTEWANLRALLVTENDLARWLRRPGARYFAEMPFLWRMNDRECLEGIIDLAIHDPASGVWLILDWKTNRVEKEKLAELQTHYAPQIAAYRAMLAEITGARVEAALYSTACAAWLPYDTAALEAEWKRIAKDSVAINVALSTP
ncbi:MAG: UvrD-helicase domain-containing protein [Chthoniobacteraceae bacterium]